MNKTLKRFLDCAPFLPGFALVVIAAAAWLYFAKKGKGD